jgi:hypothetical protein
MTRPFEVEYDYLQAHLDEMVDATFSDLQSQFLVLPKGTGFVEYADFQDAYEIFKKYTAAFARLTELDIWNALRADALSFLVLRTIVGMTPPEWADLARSERGSDIAQGYARGLDSRCRARKDYFSRLSRPRDAKAMDRIDALVSVAVQYISAGAPPGAENTVHRINKVDTAHGLVSLQHVASMHVPYATLLYERYLGRPFASHRDAVSELVGDVMESAIEDQLARARITFRKTKRAERVPGYEQAPDFFVSDENNASVLIEAKITGDDGTARDKVARILNLAHMRDERLRRGARSFEVIACVDGRGFGVRREDMKRILIACRGKVFTLRTLEHLIGSTRLRDFLPMSTSEQ